ncbi:sensor domain-containing diguanylate cyclase [Salipaludibacillus sp. CF4.18]|uniref:sensor domain-containing diguanylate cyclase n=1 Tax=Salipaludibacillus sp. CF4.18 TaxID=3373081 RepID=UPI003EE567E0
MAKKEQCDKSSRGGSLCLVAKMLEKTGFTNELSQFSLTFIHMLKEELDLQEDFILFFKDSSQPCFQPYESSNINVLNSKDYEKVEASSILEVFTNEEMEIRPFLKKHEVTLKSQLFTNIKSDYVLFPLYANNEMLGFVMVLLLENDNFSTSSVEAIADISELLAPWFKRLIDYKETMNEKIQKELLLKVNRKFYSSMDVNGILKEILHALSEAYPTFTIELLLSNDWKVSEYLSAQPLDINDGKENYAAEAYLTGNVLTMDLIEKKKTMLYIPLKGKQGVYGVFKMTATYSQIFKDQEIDFIQVLADTGGIAIENAELYQQSRKHIADLQLINQTSHELNGNLKLDEAIGILVEKMKKAFSADEVCFQMADRHLLNDHSENKLFSCEQVKVLSEQLLTQMEETQKEIFHSDFQKTTNEVVPYKSVIGVPMLHDNHILGAVIVFGKEEYAFSYDAFKLCQSLVHHSTLAFVNAMLHAEMKELIITDYLSKLYTREYMDEQVLGSMNADGFGSFVLLDIDNFKKVNDQYGHQSGDDVIIQVAKVIIENIKSGYDIPVRWGGEELAIYLPRTKIVDAKNVAERIRKKVEILTLPKVTVSCGVSYWSNTLGVPSATKLFNQADNAMYEAKNSGRNTVIVYQETD